MESGGSGIEVVLLWPGTLWERRMTGALWVHSKRIEDVVLILRGFSGTIAYNIFDMMERQVCQWRAGIAAK